MSYRDGISQYVPPDYERLDGARERIGGDAILDLLATGKMQAFKIVDATGELDPIASRAWVSKDGPGMLHFGYWAPRYYRYGNGWGPLDFRNKDSAQLIVVKTNRTSTAPAPKVSPAQVTREIMKYADGIRTEAQVRAEVEIHLGHITNGPWRSSWKKVPLPNKRPRGNPPK